MTARTHPREWRINDGLVPIADVVKTAPVTRASIDAATRGGLIEVRRQGGHGNTRWIAVEDADLIMAVAALAIVLGLAFGALMRIVRETGASVTPQGVTIPIPAAA